MYVHARIPAGPPFIEAGLLQGTMPGREGHNCQGIKKGVGRSSQGCNCCYVEENTGFGLSQFNLV